MQLTSIHRVKRIHLLILLGVLIIASIPRLADGMQMSGFRYDAGTLSSLVLDMVYASKIPLLGIQSSAGVPNSPMTVYVLAPFFAISDNPLFTTLMIGVWNIIGVGLLWFFAHRYFGPTVGALTGVLYAVSPTAVIYSRSIWAQNYHTPFIILAILLGCLGFIEGKRWAQILCLPVLLIGVQIHFAAWTLMPLYLWFLWLGRRKTSLITLGISLLLAIAVMAPFAAGISQNSGGAENRFETIVALITSGLRFRPDALHHTYSLATGFGVGEFVRDSHGQLLSEVPRIDILWQIPLLFIAVGLLAVWRKPWRHLAVLVWLWLWLTPLIFLPIWTGSGVYIHYLIPTIPALMLSAGIGAGWLQKTISSRIHHVQWAVPIIIGFIGLSQITFMLGLLDFSNRVYSVSADQGQTTTPLHYLLDVRDKLQAYDDVIILGANPHESNFYIWRPMLYNTAQCVRDLLVNDGRIDILPDGSFAVLVAPLNPINATYTIPARYQHDEPQVISLRPDEDPYIIYGFESAPEWTETPITPVDSLPFESDVRLSGYYLSDDTLQLRWHVEHAPGQEYQYYAHFLDAQGERIGQRDAPFYPGGQWCDGDVLITTTHINLPADTATIRVGMYAINETGKVIGQSLVDESGQFHGQWVDIPIQ